jgi:multicomponent K+:H+ antiporter subunit G
MSMIAEALIAFFLVTGALFALIGSWGLVKLPDFYMRLHGPSKASTMGVGGMLLASMLYFAVHQAPSLYELLIILFLCISTPVSAHLLVKAALHLKVRAACGLPVEDDQQQG